MLIYYSNATGKEDVAAESPLECELESVLDIFHKLNSGDGFMGVQVSEQLWLQVLKRRKNMELEILDRLARTVEIAPGSAEEIEAILRQCGTGKDVLSVARRTLGGWDRIDLSASPPHEQTQNTTLQSAQAVAADSTEAPQWSIRFQATEAGLRDGVAGASNSKAQEAYHYILFAAQTNPQHPENSGVYFEFDDQSNGAVNGVKEVILQQGEVRFILRSGSSIGVASSTDPADWESFIQAVQENFEVRKVE